QLKSLRLAFEMRSSRFTEESVATRGDRLVLGRWLLEAFDGDGGPSEIEFLQVTEVDDHGAAITVVAFDPDDLDAAHAHLHALDLAGEAAPYARTWEFALGFGRAIAARDWEQLAAAFVPDFVVEDHRPVGPLKSFSADQYVASVRALFDLRPDTTYRLDHV